MRALSVIPAALLLVAFRANAQCAPAVQKLVNDQKYDEARTEAQALIAKNASDDVALHCMGRIYSAMDKAGDAAEWFEKNAKKYNVDTKRIVVTGGSAGGHLSLMVGMTPKSANLGPPAKVAAVVNFYGITNVGDQLGGPNMRDYAVTWVPEQSGRLELARRVSPMTYVRSAE